MRPRPLLLLLAGLVFVPALATAKPFASGDLLVGRSLKQPPDGKTVGVGLNAQVAPMDAAMGYLKDDLRDRAVTEACRTQADTAACEAQARDLANRALDAMAEIPDEQWAKAQELAGASPQELDTLLLRNGVTDPAVRAAVVDYVEKSGTTPDERRKAVAAVQYAAQADDAVNLLLEPYLDINTKYLAIGLLVPMTLRFSGGNTDFALGNITLDLKAGETWDLSNSGFAVGITGGLSTYLPTGTGQSNRAAQADLFQAPKFLKEYLTFAPYLVVGADFWNWVEWQVYLEYLVQVGVRSGYAESDVHYLKWGTGLLLFPDFLLSVIAELNGLTPLSDNAATYNALFFVGGLQLKVSVFKLALAVQAPVWSNRPNPVGDIAYAGVPVGKMAAWTFLARIGFVF